MNDLEPRRKDMSWTRFLGVFCVILIFAALLVPVPSRGPAGTGVVPADCVPALAGTVAIGAFAVVLARAWVSRRRFGTYSTPRRDIALSSFVMSAALIYLWPLACFP
jgi:hypothetical protein